MTIRTHYDNLHVRSDADDATIRQAYRRLSKLYHPDLNNDPDAHRIMQLINQAYEVLSNPQKRAEHDRWIAQQRAALQTQHFAPTVQAATPSSPPPQQPARPRWRTWLWVSLSILLTIGLAIQIAWWQLEPQNPNSLLSASASQPLASQALVHIGDTPISASLPDIAAASNPAADWNYIRPLSAPNGTPFPEQAAYIDGYPVQTGQGNYRIYVENIRNSSDVFAQLFVENGSEPLRSFFIPERSQFELPQLDAGRYLLRYQQLDGGELLSSETIVLQGNQQEATIYLQRGRAPVTY